MLEDVVLKEGTDYSPSQKKIKEIEDHKYFKGKEKHQDIGWGNTVVSYCENVLGIPIEDKYKEMISQLGKEEKLIDCKEHGLYSIEKSEIILKKEELLEFKQNKDFSRIMQYFTIWFIPCGDCNEKSTDDVQLDDWYAEVEIVRNNN
jgi:uncharacterized protein YheU (UPF0270 family)